MLTVVELLAAAADDDVDVDGVCYMLIFCRIYPGESMHNHPLREEENFLRNWKLKLSRSDLRLVVVEVEGAQIEETV